MTCSDDPSAGCVAYIVQHRELCLAPDPEPDQRMTESSALRSRAETSPARAALLHANENSSTTAADTCGACASPP